MDQLKDFLRLLIKYRFWVAVCVSALLPIIAYAIGSGPVKASAAAQTSAIKAADTDAKKYASGVIPNQQYKPMVDKEKETLSHDVTSSHTKLYSRQAPLLTWPKTVEERFQTWGRKWPENVDPSQVQLAIIDYVTAYPKYVSDVYKTFHPYDPAEGTGVVLAPPELALLRPSQFTIEHPPDLGKVWSAQERLWIQSTLLKVVADVNRDAKDWSTAIIKQINQLEVGTIEAQDQISKAKNELPEPAPPLTPPGAAPPPPPAAATPGASSGASGDQDEVYYIKTTSTKYKVLPFQMSVLIEQDHIQDFLVALENSPMAIQVVDFEESKPLTPVVRPQKGEGLNPYGMGGMPGPMHLGGRPGGPSVIPFGQRPQYPGPGGPAGRPKGGTDVRSVNLESMRRKDQELASQTATVTIHDPYYYIVEVVVFGQARFYNPPPPEPVVAEPAPSAATAEPTAAPPAEAATPPAPKAEGSAPVATPDQPAPKAESPATPPVAPEGAAPKP